MAELSDRVTLSVDTLVHVYRFLRECEFGQQQISYGSFYGGDPRTFTPDEESSTEEERTRWRADCERWAAADKTPDPEPGPHEELRDEEGRLVVRLTRNGYGLGINVLSPDPEDEQAIREIEDALRGEL